jgi:hypothetical protein
VRRGQLAILPSGTGRRAERRVVNLAASLREPGASLSEIEVLDLSIYGFGAEVDADLVAGTIVWLKLPDLEPLSSNVVWVDGNKAGFEFTTPLHPKTLELLIAAGKKPLRKGHFGPQPPAPGPR